MDRHPPAPARTYGTGLPFAVLLLLFGAAAGASTVGRVPGAFGVDPAGGAFYSIPLEVAAGSGGLKPGLALRYQSHELDGHAGVGWSLTGLSRISRCPRTIAVDGRTRGVRFDGDDRFCLDGQPLVLVAGSYGADGAEYRTQVDRHLRLWSRGRAGEGPAWFELRDTAGRTTIYGQAPAARIVADAAGTVHHWALEAVEDRFGNRISYGWTPDPRGGELYPAEIRWTAEAAGGQPRFRLVFAWESRPAADQRSGYVAGSPWHRSLRLTTIRYESREGSGFGLVHRYTLNYATPTGSGSRRSQLASVEQCGPRECLPLTRFTWRNGVAGFAGPVDGPIDDHAVNGVFGDHNGNGFTDLLVPRGSGSQQTWHLRYGTVAGTLQAATVNTGIPYGGPGLGLDVDGDGRRDLLAPAPALPAKNWRLHRARGNGSFDPPVDLGLSGVLVSGPAVLDVDGDGRSDLVYVRASAVYLRRSTGTGFGPEEPTGIQGSGSYAQATYPYRNGAQPADFDGDGRQDLLVQMATGGAGLPVTFHWAAFRATDQGFEPYGVTPMAHDVLPLDINGDGLTDLAWHDAASGQWFTRISTGSGFLPAQPTGITVPQGTPMRVLDYQGDGLDDLLRRLDGSHWRVHYSSGSVTAPAYSDTVSSRFINVPGQPSPDYTMVLAFVDLNGDGYQDLVAARPSGQWQVRLRQGPRADLLASVTDGLGNAWQPAFAALSGFAGHTAGSTAAPGERDLRGGPLYVVSGYTASDGAGGSYALSYAYWGARLSLTGRGFLGFARIRATDSRYQALHGTGVWTETVYRQDFPFIGAVELQTTARSDGRQVLVVDPAWSQHARPAAAGDPAGSYHFPHATSETRREYEQDPAGGSLGQLVRTTVTSRTWDFNHGVPRVETETVSAPQAAGTYSTTRTLTLNDSLRTGPGCLGLPSRLDIRRTVPGQTAETRTVQYGYHASTCAVLTETAGPPANPARQLRTSYTWTPAGQVAETRRQPVDGSEAVRRTTWTWAESASRPLTETAHISGQASPVITQDWHHGLDRETRRTSPRGLTTTWEWDDFGRLTVERRPDGPDTTHSYLACPACLSGTTVYEIRVQRSDGFRSSTFHDPLGRTVAREFLVLGSAVSRQLTEFDALGRLRRQSAPFLAGETTFWTQYETDLLGRPVAETRPVAEDTAATATSRWVRNGLVTTITDGENRVSSQTRDPEDRLVAVSSPGGGTTDYRYAPFGEPSRVTDANGITTILSYDERGFLTATESPDTGRRTTLLNAFGELASQSDAASPPRTISFSYDQLGRLVQRSDGSEGTTRWEYEGASGPALGLLRRVQSTLDGDPAGYTETYSYDALGRRTETATTLAGSTWRTTYGWDSLGRPDTITYPATVGGARPRFGYRYDPAGYLATIQQDVSGGGTGGYWLQVYQVQAMDAAGREARLRYGSFVGVDEQRLHDRATGRLRTIRTGPNLGTQTQHYDYAWDQSGNLLRRRDLNQNLSEEFSYDSENRLTGVRLNGTQTLSLDWDAGGRLRHKSDVGHYSYGSARPGAVSAISGGPRGNLNFAYDANGNMVQRQGRPITWTVAHQPRRVNYGSQDYAEFSYGPERQRIRQVSRTGSQTVTTLYLGPHFEVEIRGTSRRYRSTVLAGGRAVYSQVEQDSPAAFEAYFLHRDAQGSVDTLSRVVGTGADRLPLRFDAFGKRRNANWSADPADQRFADNHWLERGYTGHEHLDNVRLVHMNGRLQDPVLGLMLSPDPALGQLARPQTLSRYVYGAGNPATFVDPSGFFLDEVADFLRRAIRRAGSFLQRLIRNYGRELLAAVAAFYTGGFVADAYVGAYGTGASAIAAGNTLGAMAGGAVAGTIATGELKGAVAGAVSGASFAAVGNLYGGVWSPSRVLAQGAVGGTMSYIQGGEFGRGLAFAGSAAGLRYAYNGIVGYDAVWEQGGPAQDKARFRMPIEGANNFGSAGIVDPTAFGGEGGILSRFMNRIPGMNAIAGMHDVFQVRLDLLGGDRYGWFLRTSLNFPGMPVAAAMTYPALLDGVPAVLLAND